MRVPRWALDVLITASASPSKSRHSEKRSSSANANWPNSSAPPNQPSPDSKAAATPPASPPSTELPTPSTPNSPSASPTPTNSSALHWAVPRSLRSRPTDEVGQSCAGVRVSAGYHVGVFVECCRDSAVIETSRHNDDRHRSLQHFGGHEVAEIVQAKVAKPGAAAMADKGFRHTVRLPRADTAVIGEQVCIRCWRYRE